MQSGSNYMIIENGVLKKYIIDPNDPNIFFNGYGIPHGSIKYLEIPEDVIEIGDHALSGWFIHKIIFPSRIEKISESAFEDSRLGDVVGPKEFFNKQDKSWFLNRFGAPVSMYFNGVIDKTSPAWSYFSGAIRRNQWNIWNEIINHNDVEKLELLLNVWKKAPLDILDAYMTFAQEHNLLEIMTVLLNYKNKHYSVEGIDGKMSIGELTVSEWRKIFKFSICQRNVKISAYRSNEQDVVIPEYIGNNKVTMIGKGAFRGSGIKTITLPNSIEEISDDAFMECNGLQIRTFLNSFSHKYAEKHNIPLVILSDKQPVEISEVERTIENNQKTVTDWRKTYGKIAIFNETVKIGKYIGKDKKVIIPEKIGSNNVREIEEKAFYKNIDITEVVISEGISVIGDKAFYGCKNLFKITLPGTLKELGTDVFKECTSLRELIISEGQDCFYMWMIESCKTITDIYLPSSIDDLELEQKKNITVHVPAGSYAETYVKENDIKFVVN